jgi:hypothetical protein
VRQNAALVAQLNAISTTNATASLEATRAVMMDYARCLGVTLSSRVWDVGPLVDSTSRIHPACYTMEQELHVIESACSMLLNGCLGGGFWQVFVVPGLAHCRFVWQSQA